MILVIAERFIKMLKSKIYKRMTDNDSKSYLPYLNKILVYVITYLNKILVYVIILIIILLTKNPLMLIILFRLKTYRKAYKFKLNDRVRTTKYKNISIKVILKILQEKYLLLILF